MSQSASSSGESTVFPYHVPYSTPTDVGRKFGNTNLFTASTVPSTSDIQDVIVRKDSWIDNYTGHDWLLHTTAELYDAVGSGPRAGMCFLRNWPVISVQALEYWDTSSNAPGQWIPGVQGLVQDALNVTVGTPPRQPDTFYFYPEQAMVVWHKYRYQDRQRYRVRYTYGYPSIPDFVRDLSANLAAQEAVMIFSGKFMPPEASVIDYERRFRDEEYRLTAQLTIHRPLIATA